ncbi:iron-containing alcohol dehydrogenase [Spirochaeta cellobiosiphila]|uniref:iron-containing alcohol dehydrogenase n=1 Tax=Spirochaeta cellobiosiphila TaxID=504483 RepID=UPI0003FAE04E|nr:iron-containing alcohol dehydrogenase [Spirochaeta cellobiosiphila]
MYFGYPRDIYIGSLDKLGVVAKGLGAKALVVRDSAFRTEKDHGEIEDYLKEKGLSVMIFDDLRIGDTLSSLEGAQQMIEAGHCDLVIGVGGVITLSFARYLAHLGRKLSYDDPENTKLPYISIPSTDRNPFLFRDMVLLTGGKSHRLKFIKINSQPLEALFYNPSFTSGNTEIYAISSLLEMLLNGIETFLKTDNDLFVQSMLYGVIAKIYEMIDNAYHRQENWLVKKSISEAGFVISLALGQASLGTASLFAYTLDGMISSPRSIVSSILLPSVIETGARKNPEGLMKLGLIFREDIDLLPVESIKKGMVGSIKRLMTRYNIPMRISNIEIPRDVIDNAVERLEGELKHEIKHALLTTGELRSIINDYY